MSEYTKGESEYLNILMSAWIAGQTAERYGKSTENKIKADCEGLMRIKPQFAITIDLLEACEYTKTLLSKGIGQHTHALALIEAAVAKAQSKQSVVPCKNEESRQGEMEK